MGYFLARQAVAPLLVGSGGSFSKATQLTQCQPVNGALKPGISLLFLQAVARGDQINIHVAKWIFHAERQSTLEHQIPGARYRAWGLPFMSPSADAGCGRLLKR